MTEPSADSRFNRRDELVACKGNRKSSDFHGVGAVQSDGFHGMGAITTQTASMACFEGCMRAQDAGLSKPLALAELRHFATAL